MASAITHPLVIISEHCFSYEDKRVLALFTDAICNIAQIREKTSIKTIGNVEPEAIYPQFMFPIAYGFGQIVIERHA